MAAERQGVERAAVSGTTQNDILKEYIARGTWIYPPRPSMRLVTDVFEFCARELPRWNTISISGYHMREAGATAVQELAYTLADAIAYCDAAVARGLDIDDFAGRLSFFFAAWSELFEEVAKFRAARRMWARIVRERYGSQNPRSQTCRFHVQTAGSSLTARSIDNNVVRTTVQALAAVLGGAQSLHTNSRDEALALPTAEAARLALRTQQILAYESGVTETPDPLAGSYYVETLTNELERAALGRARRDRGARRDDRRDRPRLPAAPDPGVGLPRPAPDRVGRPGRRRGQPVPGRARRRLRRLQQDRPRRGAPPGRGPPARPGRARSGGLGGRARPAAGGGRRRRQRHARPHRRRPGLRHRRRDQRSAPGGLGRAPRAHHRLSRPSISTLRSALSRTLPSGYPHRHDDERSGDRAAEACRLAFPLTSTGSGGSTMSRSSSATSRPRSAFYRDILGLELETVMPIPSDRVTIAFLPVGESKVELVAPTDDTTGVARFLESRGEGFHHVCFEVPDLAETLTRLAIDGVELIDTAPRKGAEGPGRVPPPALLPRGPGRADRGARRAGLDRPRLLTERSTRRDAGGSAARPDIGPWARRVCAWSADRPLARAGSG